ncbi:MULTISPECIES: hypothetical protein [Geobacillus]|uniref:Uncharacterized protein n=2 Tax=Anoxybacillaceae TaxID=3120669 RepID=A0A1V9CF83_9BACL|nr:MULTISPECIES: hypothetical protein [Geobacillus]ALA69827.1 hypothetical protein GT50_06030 [Geobacillus stearothermophilus 10]EPR29720.1 hypothetical protein I656_00619 [Geobacillus sp. WSUCF1]ADI25650.1 hypothetical protein GC56T3_0600 [Geobacillus sp. C56-T3]AMQ21546.1 hypothetical protein A0V43_12335 [Geobacillus sp. JS12]OQP14193.1 hypothetical protein B1693_15530 [Geobacillus zalihae]
MSAGRSLDEHFLPFYCAGLRFGAAVGVTRRENVRDKGMRLLPLGVRLMKPQREQYKRMAACERKAAMLVLVEMPNLLSFGPDVLLFLPLLLLEGL